MSAPTPRHGLERPRFIVAAIAMVVAAFVFASAVNAPVADAGQKFRAQAKKKCKNKKGAAKSKCVRKTARKLKKAERDRGKVGLMSRNVYLGADLGPAINSSGFQEFIDANGQILRDVDTNDFPVRARGLAKEIKQKTPDLVGLQEVAIWRTGPAGLPKNKPTDPSGTFVSTEVKYDYLNLLMRQLNKGKKRYRVAQVTTEFDFEAPANFDGDPSTGVFGGEINGRLTMRDVILARVDAGVKVRNARGANYNNFYNPVISGIPVTVDRGWGSVKAKVRKSPWFKFVNTHLEAFGDDKNKVVDCMTDPAPEFAANPVSIRCSQAEELFEVAIRPSDFPVIATGDFNSDDVSVIDDNCPSEENTNGTLVGNNGGLCGDTFAYNALTTLGMKNVSTSDPFSCCVRSDILTADNGDPSDFRKHIDHILTDSDRVKKLNSSISGLTPMNGFWNSDHAGVYSLVKVNE